MSVIFFPGSSESKIFRGLKIAGIPDIDTFYIARFDSISSRLENQDSNILRIPTFQNLIFFSFFFKLRKILMNIFEGEIAVTERTETPTMALLRVIDIFEHIRYHTFLIKTSLRVKSWRITLENVFRR